MQKLTFPVAIAAAVLAIASCHEPAAPRPQNLAYVGDYQLILAGPVVDAVNPNRYVHGMTLQIRSDGTWVSATLFRPGPDTAGVASYGTDAGRWTASQNGIDLSPVDTGHLVDEGDGKHLILTECVCCFSCKDYDFKKVR